MKLIENASAILESTFICDTNIIDSIKHCFVANTCSRKR